MKEKLILCAAAAAALCLCAGCFAKRETPDASAASDTDPTTTTSVTAMTAIPPTTTRSPYDETEPSDAGFSSFPAKGYSTTDDLCVRPQANTDYIAVGGLTFQEEVTVVGKTGDWYEIQWPTYTDNEGNLRETAFVSAQYISASRPKPTTTTTAAETTAETAETTAGTATTAA